MIRLINPREVVSRYLAGEFVSPYEMVAACAHFSDWLAAGLSRDRRFFHRAIEGGKR